MLSLSEADIGGHVVSEQSAALSSTGQLRHSQRALTCRPCICRCSHSNLQALREIDARGVSFLQCSSQGGDSRLLVESPDYGLLSAEDSTDAENTIQYIPSSRESCQAGSTKGHMPVGQPLSYQIGFVTN